MPRTIRRLRTAAPSTTRRIPERPSTFCWRRSTSIRTPCGASYGANRPALRTSRYTWTRAPARSRKSCTRERTDVLNWLLIFVPVAVGLQYLAPTYHTAIFIAACLAIIPLAGWLGTATEQLAHHTGEGIGGLLNATFGNAAELIIAFMALREGLYPVVKASLTGSILGNLLLVLGVSVVAGGVRHKEQD